MATSDQWGTIVQAAETLNVSTRTVRRMIARGEIDARRVGPRLIRVRLSNLADIGRPLQYECREVSSGGGAARDRFTTSGELAQ